jgi:hypothetical protein
MKRGWRLHLHGHRYFAGELYCSRCGVHIAEAQIKKCMPSNVVVLRVLR